jgi:DNA repair protein RadC
MKIKDIPWYNRPGNRLKKKGASTLSDAELLAIVLGRGVECKCGSVKWLFISNAKN